MDAKAESFDIFAGLTTLNIDDITKHVIKELHNAKYKINDIAEVTGLSNRAIFRYLDNMDVKRRNKTLKRIKEKV